VARVLWFVERLVDPFRGRTCRGFVHDVARIEAQLTSAGFARTAETTHRLWHIAVFDRVGLTAG